LVRARIQVLALLQDTAVDGRLARRAEIVHRGLVRRALDADGVDVWVPVDASGIRLVDRVGALLVADYMNDPAAYAELFVCHACEAVVFDEPAKRLGICRAHPRVSGFIRTETGDPTPAYG